MLKFSGNDLPSDDGLWLWVPAFAGTTRRRFFVSAETCYEHPTCTSVQSQQELP